jgi:hypothetical protein
MDETLVLRPLALAEEFRQSHRRDARVGGVGIYLADISRPLVTPGQSSGDVWSFPCLPTRLLKR